MTDMDTLLTTRQLQTLLHVDRITIYRMLGDGRLEGFKVGGQWRFPRKAIEDWLEGRQPGLGEAAASSPAGMAPSVQSLPLSCMQAIQDIFAEALEVGAITTAVDGSPLTTPSNSCALCDLVLGTEAGRQRCINAWREAAMGDPQVTTCHAGLNYIWARIEIQGEYVAATHTGQFRSQRSDQDAGSDSLSGLSVATGLHIESLRQALALVPVLDPEREDQVCRLLQRMAATFSEIGEERQALLGRLHRIAEMTGYP
jgi:excisionase family DNA binding protein